jgi:peptidoglycan/LPS O-acetylase OafA/YrhL
MTLSHQDKSLYIVWLPLFNFSVATILLWVVYDQDSFVSNLLENAVLRWIGKISYALYLWHYLMFEFAKKEFSTKAGRVLVGVGLAFLLAAVSYYFVERPFLRIKDRFSIAHPRSELQFD